MRCMNTDLGYMRNEKFLNKVYFRSFLKLGDNPSAVGVTLFIRTHCVFARLLLQYTQWVSEGVNGFLQLTTDV